MENSNPVLQPDSGAPPGVTVAGQQPANPPPAGGAPAGGDPGAVPAKPDRIKEFFNTINWLEVGILALAATGMFYTISYYRFKQKEDKVANNDMWRQIDELKMNVQGALKGKYQPIDQA